nr:acyl-CoA dehydrogenase family protein [Streptomyces albus]
MTDDQLALRRGMRELLAARFGREALREAVEAPGIDRVLWRALGEAGLFSLRADEEEGGAGAGLPEAVLLFEEAGRALLPGPLVASHLAGGTGLVPGAADGTAVVTAVDAAPGAGAVAGDGVLVEHLPSADAVLVVRDGGEPVDVVAPGAPAAVPVRSLDPLSPLHRVAEGTLPASTPAGGAACGRSADGGSADGGLADGRSANEWSGNGAARGTSVRGRASGGVSAGVLRREAALLTAAQQLGSAARTVEMAVAHAREREQFGRPIGSFQAVQHLCARMLVRTETARSAVYAAAVTADETETCAAKLLADEAATANARDCLQVHGGMGFTWEADVHLHLKRAWLRAAQWRTDVEAEERLAAALRCPIPR